VLDVLNASADVAGKPVPYDVAPRRAGDPVSTYADPTFAQTALGWRAKYGLKEIIDSAYTWHCSQMKI
jgi:UDP-glucose 4-epimerase